MGRRNRTDLEEASAVDAPATTEREVGMDGDSPDEVELTWGAKDEDEAAAAGAETPPPPPSQKRGWSPFSKGDDSIDDRGGKDLDSVQKVTSSDDTEVSSSPRQGRSTASETLSKWKYPIIGALALCAGFVTLGVVMSNKHKSSAASNNTANQATTATDATTVAVASNTIDAVLLSVSEMEDLENDQSPQNLASDWIRNQDPMQLSMETSSTEKIIQRYVLAVLYFAFTGEGWTPSDNGGTGRASWLSDADECTWEDVLCTDDASSPSVKVLFLKGRNLVGRMPSEITQLQSLQILNLSSNSIQGELPQSIGDLQGLTYMDFSTNEMEGSLPDGMYDLINLEYLYLSGNAFSGSLSTKVSGWVRVVDLRIHSNNFDGDLPSTMGDMESAETIIASSNSFSKGIPESLGSIPKLQTLDLSYNELSGVLSDALYDATSLKTLYLNNNQLEGQITGDWARMTSLETLWLDNNLFSGQIAEEFASATSLVELHIHENAITGQIPDEVCKELRRDGILTELIADCGGNDPENPPIVCECCTKCLPVWID